MIVLIQIIQNNYQVDDSVKPDVWFEPSEVGLCLIQMSFTNIYLKVQKCFDANMLCLKVWEVKAGDMTISPVYSAAIGIVDRQKV